MYSTRVGNSISSLCRSTVRYDQWGWVCVWGCIGEPESCSDRRNTVLRQHLMWPGWTLCLSVHMWVRPSASCWALHSPIFHYHACWNHLWNTAAGWRKGKVNLLRRAGGARAAWTIGFQQVICWHCAGSTFCSFHTAILSEVWLFIPVMMMCFSISAGTIYMKL